MKTLITSFVLTTMLSVVHGQDQSVYIEGDDSYQFSVKQINVSPGELVEITLKTISKLPKNQMAHNWVLLKQDVNAEEFVNQCIQHKANDYIDPELTDRIIAYTDMLGDGERDSITFTAPETKGVYTYVCTFPGHFLLGMKGKLIVE